MSYHSSRPWFKIAKSAAMSGLVVLSYACDNNSPSLAPVFDEEDHSLTMPSRQLAIIGDSISTGVLAETSFGETPATSFFQKILSFFAENGQADSEQMQSEFSREDLAAASTDLEYGLRQLIADREGLELDQVKYISSARFGGKTTDIDEMLDKLETSYQESNEGQSADYVLFMLGANDFCANLSAEDFKDSVESALDKTAQLHSQSTMLVSLIPPVYQIPQFQHEYGPRLPNGNQQVLVSCQDFQMNTCEAAFADDAQERYQAFNEAIVEVVDQIKDDYSDLKIFLVDDIANWELSEPELSVDCFHPSQAGQATIGQYFGKALDSGD